MTKYYKCLTSERYYYIRPIRNNEITMFNETIDKINHIIIHLYINKKRFYCIDETCYDNAIDDTKEITKQEFREAFNKFKHYINNYKI